MSTSEIIVVESTNTSNNNNKTSLFQTRLPRDFIFDQIHQLALVDVSIPNTIFNVKVNNFFIVTCLTRGKIPIRAKSEEKLIDLDVKTIPSSPPQPRRRRYDSVELTVKVTLPPGHYNSIKSLVSEIERAAIHVLDQQALKKIYKPGYGSIIKNRFFEGESEGWYAGGSDGEGSRVFKDDYLIPAFKRIAFRENMGTVSFRPLSKTTKTKNDVCMHFSEDIGLVLGFPPSQKHILLHAVESHMKYAPYLARIQAEDTIYLYCHQIKNTIVSNFDVPILRCLPFSSRKLNFGDVFFMEFTNQVYIDLISERLYSLSFELRNYKGELIEFEAGSKPVRLTLQIKPKF